MCFFGGGYIFVDFFFVLQGFYLIKQWGTEQNAYEVAFSYILSRLRRFFPGVFFSAVLMLLLQMFSCSNGKHLVNLVIAFLAQISFVSQLFSFLQLGAGGIFWFLSASVIVGTILVFICTLLGKKFIIIAPFFVAIFYNDIYQSFGNMDVWWQLVLGETVKVSLERAAAGIMLGIVVRYISLYIKQICFRQHILVMLKIVTVILSIIPILFAVITPYSVADFYLVVLFALIMLLADNLFDGIDCEFTNYLDELCMPMYIFQVLSFMIVSKFCSPNYISALIVLLIDYILSALWVNRLSKVRVRKLLVKE